MGKKVRIFIVVATVVVLGVWTTALWRERARYSKMARVADELEDHNRLKRILVLMHTNAPKPRWAADGRVDVYGVLLQAGLAEEEIIDLCRSSRSRGGPTLDEIRAGDYSDFPFARRRQPLTGSATEVLLWDRRPQFLGRRLFGLHGAAVKYVPEAAFADELARMGARE